MKRVLICCVLLAGVAHAAERPQDFNWRAPVKTEANAPYYRVTLPVEAYLNATQPGIADLRVFNAAGVAVPYARVTPAGSNERSTQRTALRWFPLRAAVADGGASTLKVTVRQASDGTLVEVRTKSGGPSAGKVEAVRGYLLDASKLTHREQCEGLELDWAGSADGFQLLNIEASDDLQDWHSVRRNVQLARLDFNGERIEQRRISLAGLPGRYLRLHWLDPVQAPELISASIEQSSAQWKNPPLAWSAPIAPQSVPLGLQPGKFQYQLPQALPVSRIRIALPEGNALLPLEILQPDQAKRHWPSIARSVVYRINSNGREWMQDEVALSGQWLKEFIVRIDPRSSKGVNVPNVQIGIAPEQVVFLAEGAPPFTLAVGQAKTATAALPLSMLVPGFGSANAPQIAEATLDHATVSAVAASSPGVVAITPADWKKIALWGLLVAGVLAMGAMAWQLVRQMQRKE